MIPLYDILPSRRKPYVMWGIILINVIVYIYELTLGSRGMKVFFYLYGLVPARYTIEQFQALTGLEPSFFPFISHMFIHGNFLHILGNMWFLWIFGDNVEDILGHIRFAIFYISSGIIASLFHFILNIHSTVPMVGASGAISAVMGSYFVLFPYSRIVTLFPLLFFFTLIEIPAYFFLFIWFILQLVNGLSASVTFSNVAWWAHVGGFVVGMIWGWFFRKRIYWL